MAVRLDLGRTSGISAGTIKQLGIRAASDALGHVKPVTTTVSSNAEIVKRGKIIGYEQITLTPPEEMLSSMDKRQEARLAAA